MRRRYLPGYLTVYVSLTLAVVLSLCLVLIEGARRSVMGLEAECAVDLGMDSVLAEYHREVFDRYGLLVLDTSYGTDYPSCYNTQAHLDYYLEQNLSCEDRRLGFLYGDLLRPSLSQTTIRRISLITDQEGAVFRRRALEVMKAKMGLEIIEKVTDWVGTVEEKGLLERNMEAEAAAVEQQIQTCGELSEAEWTKTRIKSPAAFEEEMRREGILKWVIREGETLSGQVIDTGQYLSGRAARGELNRGSGEAVAELDPLEEILYHEFLLENSGHYGACRQGSLLQYQTEYLLAGCGKDSENLSRTADWICAIREVANTLYLYGDSVKSEEVRTAAQFLSELFALPEIEPLLETAIFLGWAYLESLYDVKLLLEGGRVPLMKEKESWHYGLRGIWSSLTEGSAPDGNADGESRTEGLCYEDYLRVLLCLEDQETLTCRFLDLMEMDVRATEGNAAFRADGCAVSLTAEVTVESAFGYSITLEREKTY